MTPDGANLLVSQLAREGVTALFSLNGGHIAPIYNACLDAGIDIVDVRHEDAAVHMAHAYARMTGDVGVACLTAGPGVTNGVSAVAGASVGSAPVFVLGGKVPVAQFDLGALQDVDQVSILSPVTRSARTGFEASRLPEYVAESMRLARVAPQQPVYLEVPTDVLRTQIPGADRSQHLVDPALPNLPGVNPSDLAAALSILTSAERPVLVVGSGVLWSHAEEAVKSLAELLAMPVLTTSLARGILPKDHPLNLFAARSALLGDADVVLVVGTRFNYLLNYGRPPRIPSTASVIQIDAAAGELNRNRAVDLAVNADARLALEALVDAADPVADREWLGPVRKRHDGARKRLAEQGTTHGGAVHPLHLCFEVARAAPPGTRFVADGGDVLSFARVAIQPDGPRRFLDPGPYGGLGVGVPYANAVKRAAPDDPVVLITGDGALGLNVMELETAVRHGLGIVVVVSNNAAWGIERNSQVEDFGADRVVATELRNCRFDAVAEAVGMRGIRVIDGNEIKTVIAEALSSSEPVLVDVVTDVDVRSPDLARGLARVPDSSPLEWTSQ